MLMLADKAEEVATPSATATPTATPTPTPPPVAVVADAYRFVIGVDTHARFHCYAIVEAGTGRVLDEATFPTSQPGLARAADWIGRRTAAISEDCLTTSVTKKCERY